jgi:hypothetical protein
VTYESPKLVVIGSVADLTRVVKSVQPTSDGTYLHPGRQPLNNYTSP